MLRYLLRRFLWAVPALVGISLVVFFVSTLIPEPGVADVASRVALLAGDPEAYDSLEDQRRTRSLDVPRFFDVTPDDVRSRAEAAVAHLTAEDAEAPLAAHALVKLGGAAFPYVLPKLDNLTPAARGRVAVALAPVAERMGVGINANLRDPARASSYWTRFWEDRALDFHDSSVRRLVGRYLRQATDMRERDLIELDTYAVPAAMEELALPHDVLEQRLLLAVVARATGRKAAVIQPDSDVRAANAVVAEWRDWWFVHHTDYDALEGAARIAASVTETRYGRWLGRTLSGRLGFSARDGEPILDKLLARAPLTLTLASLALLVALASAVPLALVAAMRRGQSLDHWLAIGLFFLYSAPTFWLAQLLSNLAPRAAGSLVLAVIALAAPVAALTVRYQRSALLEVLGLDYVRSARAKGVYGFRLLFLHALPNAFAPTLSLAGVLLPQILGSAFVVEEVFGLPGLGFESVRAVEANDHSWLVAVTMLTAVLCSMGLIASDLAAGVIDPRVRELLRRRGRVA
jgi:ABC-type dipeptide/oligopeptide/nickel transport system permease component